MNGRLRPTWAEVDLGVVRANTTALRAACATAEVMAVVKADAYGHGAVEVSRATLDAGAAYLGVALVEEGVELREAGIEAPIVVLSEPPPDAAAEVVAHRLTPVVYRPSGVEAIAAAARKADLPRPFPVHLKVDTGMHRVGCTPGDAAVLAEKIAGTGSLRLEGFCTHFALADEPDEPYTGRQIAAFDQARESLSRRGLNPPVVHAANSAAIIAFPAAHYDLVRAGITVYGLPPSPAFDGALDIHPALSLRSRVVHVQDLDAGDRVSYGLRYALARRARVATVPVGYADGVPRSLAAAGGEVLVRGRRYPIAGTVTMDHIMLDAGDAEIAVGDDVVLLGRQEGEQVTATEWADRTGTIAYEIVSRIGSRVPRVFTS